MTTAEQALDELIAATYATAESASRTFEAATTAAERLCWLRTARWAAQHHPSATHLVIDWGGEAWFPIALEAADGTVVHRLDEYEAEMAPTPSDAASWIEFLDGARPNTSCLKHLLLEAIRTAVQTSEEETWTRP